MMAFAPSTRIFLLSFLLFTQGNVYAMMGEGRELEALVKRQTSDPTDFPSACATQCNTLLNALNKCPTGAASCLCTTGISIALSACESCVVKVLPGDDEISQLAIATVQGFNIECAGKSVPQATISGVSSPSATGTLPGLPTFSGTGDSIDNFPSATFSFPSIPSATSVSSSGSGEDDGLGLGGGSNSDDNTDPDSKGNGGGLSGLKGLGGGMTLKPSMSSLGLIFGVLLAGSGLLEFLS